MTTIQNTISEIPLDMLNEALSNPDNDIHIRSPFILPFWMKAWHRHLGKNTNPLVLLGRTGEKITGIAPLMRMNNQSAGFLGDESVCDFQDMILGPAEPDHFFSDLIDYLKNSGIRTLMLAGLKKDSPVLEILPEVCRKKGLKTSCINAGNLYTMDMADSFEAYLLNLNGKHRHEIRRKLRRLSEAGQIEFHMTRSLKNPDDEYAKFLSLFKSSRPDKDQFMTDRMQGYFKTLFYDLEKQRILRLGNLSIHGKRVATTFSFDFNDELFLYNNGYDPEYNNLSVGLLSKIYTIRYAIENHYTRFNFLKGDEVYKKHLGGTKKPLYRLTVSIDPF